MLGATVKYHTIQNGDKHKIPVSKWPIRFEIFQPFTPNISTMKHVFDNLREFPLGNLNVSEYYGEFLWNKHSTRNDVNR